MLPSVNEDQESRVIRPIVPDAGRDSARRPVTVIGNPENRRVSLFREALGRIGLPAPTVISYNDLVRGQANLCDAIPAGAVVRIESPGENETVERKLVELGAKDMPTDSLPASCSLARRVDHGLIYYPRLWYRGFCRLLARLHRDLDARVVWMNHPTEIATAFDKLACHCLFREKRLPVPETLGSISDYADLRRRMREKDRSRAFVKLSYGSSASGVVAFQTNGRSVRATTSVEMVRAGKSFQLYNSLRVRCYQRERDVAALIDALCDQGAHAEVWLPKAGFDGRTFDLRVLLIDNQVRHVVMRTSRGPITNLHLGNRRGDVERLLRVVEPRCVAAAWKSCRRAAELFPRSLYAGVDLMFLPGFRRHAVLEINAFGDLLPNVFHKGQDTYTAEWEAVAVRLRANSQP